MTRWTRVFPILAVSVLLAACGQESGDNPLAPESARTSTGWAVGGNVTGSGEGETGEPTASADTAVPSDTTARGGGWAVGGT